MNPTKQRILTTALTWWRTGHQPLPLRTDLPKVPAVKWTDYQQTRLTQTELETLFDRETDGLGIICGKISNGLEMLEFEGRALNEGYLQQLATLFQQADRADLWTRITNGYSEITPSGGGHYYYHVQNGEAAPNTKLASRPSTTTELEAWKTREQAKANQITNPELRQQRLNRIENTQPAQVPQVLIETRGEGGFTVIAPSGGRSHPTGQTWTTLTGNPDHIPTITTTDRDLIYSLAKQLDTMPKTMPTQKPAPLPKPNGQPGNRHDRPGDDYNHQTSWDELLIPDGWTKLHTTPAGTEWARPGKNPHDGTSATTGRRENNEDCLWIFSTSTGLPDNEPISKFQYFTLTQHAGDHAAATRALAKAGYGTPQPIEQPIRLTLIQGGADNPPNTPPPTAGNLALQPEPQQVILGSLTETGNAELFIHQHSRALQYVPFRKQWLSWDGTRWYPEDDTGKPIQAATDSIRSIEAVNNEIRDWKKRSLNRRILESTIMLAATHPTMRVKAENLDQDPLALNTPGGLVNLQTGNIRPTKPDDWVTKITHCAPDPNHPTPLWERFLDDTFNHDQQLIDYVQRLAGYSLTGHVTHHVLPFLHGTGNNGKSVLLDTLLKLMGDYATSAPKGFLMSGRDDPSAIARLHGVRLIVASEVNQNQSWDEALIKQLTGGDTLTARYLYSNYFTFTPSHKIWIAANHQPKVQAGGDSFWRRLRLIPFTNQVPEHERIENLTQRLVDEEGPGILAWMIQGALTQQDGLQDPETVLTATQEYAAEEDHLGRFINEKCKLGGGQNSRTKTVDLRHAYSAWCRANNENELNGQNLGRELRARFGIESTDKGKRYYDNVMLLSEEDEAPQLGWETGF